MSVPRKILIFIDYLHGEGGTERHLCMLVRHLRGRGWMVTLIAFDMGESAIVEAIRGSGAEILALPVGRVYSWRAARSAWRLFRLIRERKYDLVQTFHQKSDTYGALVARLSGVRNVIVSRRDTGEIRGRAYRWVGRLISRIYSKIIVVSDGVREAVCAREGFSENRIVRIYNGVDVDAFNPATLEGKAAARTAIGIGLDDFVVGMVANFRPEKSHEVLFEACRFAATSIPKVSLLLVGGGPLLEKFRAAYPPDRGGLEAMFVGAVTDVRPYLAAMDVACLVPCSNEGFSNAVLEAMAMGLPLVVSDVGGNREAVADGVNGRLVEPQNPEALASALVAMWQSAADRQSMGRASRSRVCSEFSIRAMLEQHDDLYRSLGL